MVYGLKKSSLENRNKGHLTRQEAHSDEQVFGPAAETAIMVQILNYNDFGFPRWLHDLIQNVKFLAKNEHQQRIPMGHQQNHSIGKNWITHLLNWHLVLTSNFACCIDWQPSYANNHHIILNHFWKVGNVIRKNHINPQAITNIDKTGLLFVYARLTTIISSRGWKNSRVKPHGNCEFVTAVEAVSAYGNVFHSFVIEKKKVHRTG